MTIGPISTTSSLLSALYGQENNLGHLQSQLTILQETGTVLPPTPSAEPPSSTIVDPQLASAQLLLNQIAPNTRPLTASVDSLLLYKASVLQAYQGTGLTPTPLIDTQA